jgi:hypothetical protein
MSMIYHNATKAHLHRLVDEVEPLDGPIQVTNLETGESYGVEKRAGIAFGKAPIKLTRAGDSGSTGVRITYADEVNDTRIDPVELVSRKAKRIVKGRRRKPKKVKKANRKAKAA